MNEPPDCPARVRATLTLHHGGRLEAVSCSWHLPGVSSMASRVVYGTVYGPAGEHKGWRIVIPALLDAARGRRPSYVYAVAGVGSSVEE